MAIEARIEDSYSLGLAGRDPGITTENNEPSKGDDPLSEERLKTFFAAMKATADEHRKSREVIWDDCWRLYNNEYDWSDKAWWQHKTPIPKIRTAVDRAVSVFRKTLLKVQPFYGIQSESRMGRTKGRYTMLLTDYWLDQATAIEALVNGFKVGLITSTCIMKCWWMRAKDFKPLITTELLEEPTFEFGIETGSRTIENRKVTLDEFSKGKLGLAAVNPKNFWIVPGTRGRCVIERDESTLNEIEALVKDAKHPNGIYEKEAVERLRHRQVPTISQENTQQTSETRYNANTYLRNVDLWHYWGDIYDNDGRLVMADASFTLANEDILIRKPRPNPFFHKDPPYTIGSPYIVPFSTYNRGMVEDVAEIAKSITQMACLVADGGLYDAMKAFALDKSMLDDPSEAKQGIYPGKTFLFDSSMASSPNQKLVQTVEVGNVPNEAMNTINMFEKYFQEGSFVNEWVAGFGGKGDRTLGEVNIKTQSALEGLDESARNLEVTVIEPTLTMAAKVIYQYNENFLLERLMDNFPQLSMLLQDMQPAERYATMIGDFAFKVRGLSIMIDRAQRIGEFKEILTLLSYLPGFLEQLNPIATLEEILTPIGWDPAKLLLQPGQGSVTVPPGGIAPPGPAPMVQPGMTPMQTQNAQQGARMGGGRNNPSGGLQTNPAAMQQILQQLMQRR